jgi:hypothetical protein
MLNRVKAMLPSELIIILYVFSPRWVKNKKREGAGDEVKKNIDLIKPQWPFCKEFIPTKWTTTDSGWPSTKGLCWNVFILMADEVAGLRTPDMDPDYKEDK